MRVAAIQELNGVKIDRATEDDPYRAYDWKITYFVDDELREGAIGRAVSRRRCRDRVSQELAGLPPGTVARGVIVRVSVVDADFRFVIATADRDERGSITWTGH